ncbi:MAG: hypothetical protein DMG30_07030 [Acidobacteria bacterium]|nr:MAG: hypothetical protein DMG30_07030 [Acidobacteriota bacterium]
MRNHLLVFTATAVLLQLSFAGATYAHHANASFDMTNSATVKGTVTGFDWTNPHAYIYLDVNGKDAVEKWSVEMGSIGMLARAGWRRDTVKPGDEITVIGNRAKDGKTFLRLSKLVFASGQELTTTVQ